MLIENIVSILSFHVSCRGSFIVISHLFKLYLRHPSLLQRMSVILPYKFPNLRAPCHRFTPLLISRFLLNLRQVGDPGDSGTDWSDMTDLSTPQFRVPTFSILTGNLAMPLDYTTDDSSITLGDDLYRRRSRIPVSVAEPSCCEEVA